MSKPSRYILVALIFYSYAAFGQTKLNNQLFKDSVSLTLDSAENIFLRNNFFSPLIMNKTRLKYDSRPLREELWTDKWFPLGKGEGS